ncbi:MAG: IS1182 family transposase [Aestuariivirga sp.]|nr:IS1182 family transposase [Aestuariivirga sp.]
MTKGKAHVVRPQRSQVGWEMVDIDGLLPEGHAARLVWTFVTQMDLSQFYAAIGSREGDAGRPAADPQVLLALWLYAAVEGVGSARELERLVERDVSYRWIAGGVPVNYHGLSDFRTRHGGLLDTLLTESVTALMAEGLVTFEEVIADGTKVQAAAGKGSYGGTSRLERIGRIAAERMAQLKAEVDADPAASSRRRKASQLRAARELGERAAKAAAALAELQKEKEKRRKTHRSEEEGKAEPKASLTDPTARYMRFADGSIKPGYNMQIAACGNGLVLAVMATDRRNDTGLARPIVDDIVGRYGCKPGRLLVDSTYAADDDIVALARDGVMVFAPVPEERAEVKADTLRRRLAKKLNQPQELKDWRERMNTSYGQDVYRRRKRIELVNAYLKNRGLGRLSLRGIAKAKIAGLLQAIAHNIMLANHLRTKTA